MCPIERRLPITWVLALVPSDLRRCAFLECVCLGVAFLGIRWLQQRNNSGNNRDARTNLRVFVMLTTRDGHDQN
jgi:hypothetical protein